MKVGAFCMHFIRLPSAFTYSICLMDEVIEFCHDPHTNNNNVNHFNNSVVIEMWFMGRTHKILGTKPFPWTLHILCIFLH
jgi:hypothetical protein